jgi:hypothetical protein
MGATECVAFFDLVDPLVVLEDGVDEPPRCFEDGFAYPDDGSCNVLRPPREIEDQDDQQNDHEDPDQAVARSCDREHRCLLGSGRSVFRVRAARKPHLGNPNLLS